MIRYNTSSSGGPLVRAQVSAYNYCTGVFTFMSGADEFPSLFTKNDLTLSTASAAVQMTDDFGTVRMLVVNLTWSDGALGSEEERTKTVFTSPRR
jgi:hypothetical protein